MEGTVKNTCHFKMLTALWAVFGIAFLAPVSTMAAEPAWWTQMKNDCRARGGTIANAYNTAVAQGGCQLPSQSSPSSPPYDDGAARRAQVAAEAAAAAERQRQAERDRIERERRAEEKRKKDAAFIRERDAAAVHSRGHRVAATPCPSSKVLRGRIIPASKGVDSTRAAAA